LDVAAFRPLKLEWQRTLHPISTRLESIFKKKNTVVNGSRLCGISPFNPDAVNYTKFASVSQKKTTSEAPKPTQSLTHLQYLESKINLDVVSQFYETISNSVDDEWQCNVCFKKLYTSITRLSYNILSTIV
jgi:hypothetical protein